MSHDRGLSFGGDSRDSAAPADFANNRAYVIGINGYQNGIPELRTAGADAQRLGEILHESHGYSVKSLATGGAATLASLRDLLHEKMPREVGPDDRVLFYFAGHGIALDGEGGPEGYLVPEDANREDRSTFLSMTELNDALAELPCRHLVLILDCCFAGAFRWSSTRDLRTLPGVIHRERYERYIQDPAWQVLTSAAHDQTALDVLSGNTIGERLETADHSPFATALFRALEGEADLIPRGKDGQPGGDGVITATELYLYLRECVETATVEQQTRQTPGLWPLKKHGKGEYILLTPGHELNLPPAPELNYDANPYRGLQSFDEEHSQLFFGRARIIEKLHGLVSANRLTVVLGASGTGKSSVVKAGLLPRLRGADDEDWQILPVMRPGKSPLANLANLVLPGEDPDADVRERRTRLETDGNALAKRIGAWAKAQPAASRLLMTVDQFEELVTLCWDEREREQFFKLLAQALDAHPARFRLVITLRSDFEPQFSDCPLKNQWRSSRYVVPPMSTDELREAIEGPASVRVLYFQPAELVDRLIDEVIQTPGAMPLLSFTLSELFVLYLQRRGDDRCLTLDDFEQLGGVAGSLRSRATELYESLDGPHRGTMRRVMLRMVSAQGAELARRRVPRSELEYPTNAENERVASVLHRLSQARLIVEGKEVDGEPYVEPAHDALVRGWDRLLEWTRREQEQLSLRRLLTPAANDWHLHHGGTWHANPRLSLLKRVRQDEDNWLNATEAKFVSHSVVKRRRILVGIIASVATAFLVLSIITYIAVMQRNQAQLRLAQNYWKTAVTERDAFRNPLKASHYFLLAATEFRDSADSRDAQLAGNNLVRGTELLAIMEHDGDINGAALAQDGTRVLSWGADGWAKLWNAKSGGVIAQNEHQGGVAGAVFSKNEDCVLSWGADGWVKLWDAENGEVIVENEHQGGVAGAVFDKNEDRVLSWGADGWVKLWDAKSGELIAENEHQGGVTGAVFDKDEASVLSWGPDGWVVLWDADNGEVFAGNEHPGGVAGAVFGKDENSVLSWGADGVTLWDVEDAVIAQLDQERVRGAVLSEDADRILSWGDDGWGPDNWVRVWDAGSEKVIAKFNHKAKIADAVFSNDGKRVLSSTSYGQGIPVAVWDANNGKLIAAPPQYGGLLGWEFGQRYSKDGTRVLSWGGDQNKGTVRLWSAENGEVTAECTHADHVIGAAFSSDEGRVLSWSRDGSVRLWKPATGEVVAEIKHGQQVRGAAFSENEDRILSWSHGSVRLWKVADRDEMGKQSNEVVGSAVSKDAADVVSWSDDGRAWVWNAESDEVYASTQHPDGVAGAAVNHDGTRVVSWSRDGLVRVWDAKSGRVIAESNHHGEVTRALFSPDGSRVLSWGGHYDSYTVRLWDAESGQLIAQHKSTPPAAGVFSQDGTRVLSWAGTLLRLSNAEDGEVIAENKHDGAIDDATFSRDGTRVMLFCGQGNRTDLIQVPTAEGEQLIAEATQTKSPDTTSAAFSKDGDRILSFSFAGNSVSLWEAKTGKILAEYRHPSQVSGAAFNKDESQVLSCSTDGTVRLWKTENGELIAERQFREDDTPHIQGAVLSDNQERVLSWNRDGAVALWDIRTDFELPKQSLALIVEARTGTRLDQTLGKVVSLSRGEWLEKKQRYEEMSTN